MKYKVGDEVLVKLRIAKCFNDGSYTVIKNQATTLDWELIEKICVSENSIYEVPETAAEEAWEISKKFYSLSSNALIEIFDTDDIPYILDNLTFWKIKEKIEEYELNQIKFGDVVIPLKGHYREEEPGILVCAEPNGMIGVIHPGIEFTWYEKQSLKYTGRHIDIDKILKEIGDTDAQRDN